MAEEPHPFAELHVLTVDDEPFMRGLVRRLLQELHVGRISEAKDGDEALDIIKYATDPVDVILLDLEMPIMNGYSFIQKLKVECEPPRSKTPIVVVSGVGDVDAVKAVQMLGVKFFLLKPISKVDLVKRIYSAVKK